MNKSNAQALSKLIVDSDIYTREMMMNETDYIVRTITKVVYNKKCISDNWWIDNLLTIIVLINFILLWIYLCYRDYAKTKEE